MHVSPTIDEERNQIGMAGPGGKMKRRSGQAILRANCIAVGVQRGRHGLEPAFACYVVHNHELDLSKKEGGVG